ncbi:Flp pilus assembly protein CpaB [Streptomyces olivoreticuli]|uniref:Flp pilus assembly protein CpaB n=1 Tax=Streptomyces blastmyceticus TaxID=68180 RepID=A0ABN0WEU4_9ACTN|nr:Flp pilus assembly protein CpaB [Streptomyces olivoreticuli]WKK26160.1 Flp pilus assembly protein CpaB [Streptomyces olivoreticuli]
MNSRQRRGIILLLLSVLCALGAFAGVFSVIHDAESKAGPGTTAYRLRADIPAYQPLEEARDRFEKISMPKRWLPSTAVTDLGELSGKIAVTPLRKGSLLQEDMMAARPELKPGQQEIAIMIDAATGVAGKINAGSKVNIFATFDGKDQGTKPVSKVIVSGAQVIAVGKLKALDHDGSTGATTRRAGEAVPITFALDTKDAQRVAYAESFASHVRLALIAPGGDDGISSADRTYTLDSDK